MSFMSAVLKICLFYAFFVFYVLMFLVGCLTILIREGIVGGCLYTKVSLLESSRS